MRRLIEKGLKDTAQEQISSGGLKWLIIPPFLIALLLTLLSSPSFFDLHPYLWGENKIVETIQFPIFILAGIQSLIIAWHMLVQVERPSIWGFYLAFSFLMFFIALEEIAWGQQYLGFRSPDFFLDLNVQNEVTFHNIPLLQDRTDFLNLGFGIGGLVGFMVTGNHRFRKISVPGALVPWFILIITISAVGVLVDLFVESRPINYSIHIQTETAELLIGLAGVLYAWLNKRRFVNHRNRNFRADRVSTVRGELILEGNKGRVISIPKSQIPFLDGSDLHEVEKVQVSNDGTRIFWRDLNLDVSIRELLGSIGQVGKISPSFLLNRGYGWAAFIAGFVSMVWMALIAGDQKNAWLLGFSKTRLTMFVIGLGILVMIVILMYRWGKDSEWVLVVTARLNQWIGKPGIRMTITVASTLVLAASVILLAAAYLHNDPSIQVILQRLAPWLFWLSILLIEILILLATQNLAYRRSLFARAEKVLIGEDQMVISMVGGCKVSVPISWYPALDNAGPERENITYLGDGLKLFLPQLKTEIWVEDLLVER